MLVVKCGKSLDYIWFINTIWRSILHFSLIFVYIMVNKYNSLELKMLRINTFQLFIFEEFQI